MLDQLLKTLKPKQLTATTRSTGPMLIIAGAGTGKTTTITAKIAYMVEKDGIPPEQVLALTFSREAAKNMERKIRELLGENRDVKVSTFHSFCAELLRDNADKCGISDDFTILEEIDSAIFFHRYVGIDARNATHYANTISKAKDLNIPIEKFEEYLDTKKVLLLPFAREDEWEDLFHDYSVKLNSFHLKSQQEQKACREEKKRWQNFIDLHNEYRKYKGLVDAWEKYEETKSSINALDYGDLNLLALKYLNIFGTDELNSTYRYIIVDEFQDTNYVQFELIKKLTAKEQNITVVADSNQTIYAFRGAYSNNIEEFKNHFAITPEQVVSLDVSFRSTDRILSVSHSLIRSNYSPEQLDDCILLMNHIGADGENVIIQNTVDEKEEARKIVEMIEGYIATGVPLSEIAVLYRTHSQGRLIRQALMMRGLPVIVKEDTDFLKLPEIKTAFAYLYVLNDLTHPTPRGTEAWWRLFHYNNSLSSSDSIKIAEYLKKNWITLPYLLYHHIDELELSETGLSTIHKVKCIVEELAGLKTLDISDLLLEIYDRSGLSRQFSHLDTVRSREALLNLSKLHDMAVAFEQTHGKELPEFVDYLEILDEMDGNPPAARIPADDAINLMSIHAAKGLEFDVVFVISMAKDRFPLTRGGREPLIPLEFMEQYRDIFEQNLSKSKLETAIRDRKKGIKLEEERRLCYVAFTRAKTRLILTLASTYGGNPRDPSDFLFDIGLGNIPDPDHDTCNEIELGDLTYRIDREVKSRELVKDNELEREKNHWRKLVIESLDSGDLSETVHNVLVYRSLRDGTVGDYLNSINSNWTTINPEKKAGEILFNLRSGGNGLKFNPETMTFSVSSIKVYEKCPKQYELQEILRMPTRTSEDTTGAMNMGSFVHKVLEIAVRDRIGTKDELYEIVDVLIKGPEWYGVDISKARSLLEVFWLRNEHRIKDNIFVEKRFNVPINGYLFKGFIDRIDILPGSENEVEIIDYKTGMTEPSPPDRSKQLLLYAHGFRHLYPNYVVRRLTLDMLALGKPRTYELQEDGIYTGDGRIKPLDPGVIEEMAETARMIAYDYEHGFGKTEDERTCKDCGYRLYCAD
ncbi:MAG: ATP-dependent helicase [Methanosarcinaceae archaeon]|nr:ATP-dependent helicase [Methanosarcinaceae archaeon]